MRQPALQLPATSQDAPITSHTPDHPLLSEWKQLTREGLAARRAHCLAHALAWYTRALCVARQLLTHAQDSHAPHERLAAYVTAHLNLADCYADMNQPASAAECLCRAHHKLMALQDSDAAPQPLRLEAARLLQSTRAALQQGRRARSAQALHTLHALPNALMH